MHAWGSTTPPGRDALALARIALLPSGSDNTVGSRIAYFEAQFPCLHMHLSTLQVRPHGRPRMTRIQDGWLGLS
jgi:hypothetical protein